MADKRVSRSRKRELETPDEFISFTGRLIQAVAENRQKIITGGIAVVLVVLVLSGFQYYRLRTEKNAVVMLQNSLDKMNQLPESETPDALRGQIMADLKTVVEKFPGKKAGKMARLLLADMACDAKDYDTAISLYRRALSDFGKTPFYKALVQKALAFAYEQAGDIENAMKTMETLKAGPDLGFKDEALYALGRLAPASGHPEMQADYYRELLDDYPGSTYADLVREKVGVTAPEG